MPPHTRTHTSTWIMTNHTSVPCICHNSCTCVCVCTCAHSVMSTLCEPMDCSLPPLSMEFSRHEYWNGLSFPSHGDLPKCTSLDTLSLTKIHTSFKFPSLFLNVLVLFMIRSKIPYYTWLSDSLRLLLTTTVSQTFLVFDDTGSFEEYCQAFFRIYFNWDLSDIFLIINLGSTCTRIVNQELTAVGYRFVIFDSFLKNK